MGRQINQLDDLLRPIVEQLGCELWGYHYFQQGRYSTLRVYIDSPTGVTCEDCQRISAQIGAILDVENPISGPYTLEVSSPGLDRTLFTRSQYEQYIGNHIHVRLNMPMLDRRNFTGILQAVQTDSITVNVEGTEYELRLTAIEKANLVPEI